MQLAASVVCLCCGIRRAWYISESFLPLKLMFALRLVPFCVALFLSIPAIRVLCQHHQSLEECIAIDSYPMMQSHRHFLCVVF